MAKPAMFNYGRVLIILPERLGDALFHTPAIHFLREIRPQIKISVIALSAMTAELLKNNPALNAVYTTPNKFRTRALARDHDVTLNLHDHAESRKYVEWLGLPVLTHAPSPPGQHRSQRSLNLLKEMLECDIPPGCERYRLFPDAATFAAVEKLLSAAGYRAEHDILIGCHIGCHSIAKHRLSFWRPQAHPKVWPFEHFVALDAALRQYDPRLRLVLTGSRAEKRLAAKLSRLSPTAIDVVARTSVLELAALNDYLTLFVSSDTGALHVACASTVGVIALFGPTSPARTGPYPPSPLHRILQAPVISDIPVAQVVAAIVEHPSVAALLGPVKTCD